ncbi:hypothetical protein [Neodiprion sertifer nucleopolyhedrovirus]|uniref:Uncharacterized protein n=1 Tax=Neodiprion sertifer nucleopolyhedrovirus TaxID=111874 RepID=Q6JKC3_9CBAC|nr:hypothetical protein NeseNPV_gp37 [Neodiprion sertifer nucleopolyhedrovirus]AAQ96414.1 hypothetical protein [Neodiprion sertifer nucleopolyhedrovirus]
MRTAYIHEMAYDTKKIIQPCGCRTVVSEHDFFDHEYTTTTYCQQHNQENQQTIRMFEKNRNIVTSGKSYQRTRATGKLLLSDILNEQFCKELVHRLDTKKISGDLIKLCRFVKYKKQWYANDMIKVIYKKYIV